MKLILISILFLLVSCSFEKVQSKTFDVKDGQLNLTELLDGDWNKVCILTPYSTNDFAAKILGFEYNVASQSNIAMLDSISLLVTIKNGAVLGEYEIKRTNVDFSSLGAGCYPRKSSKFKVIKDEKGWHELKHT